VSDLTFLAIDPGTYKSAWVLIQAPELKPLAFGHEANEIVLQRIDKRDYGVDARPEALAIEMPASYGMAVGQELFDTCFWVGRFWACLLYPSVAADDTPCVALGCRRFSQKDTPTKTTNTHLLLSMQIKLNLTHQRYR